MLVLIPLAVLVVSLFLFHNLLGRDSGGASGWREAFLAAVIVMGAVIAISSELLGLLKGITQLGLVILWLGILFLVLALNWKRGAFKQFSLRVTGSEWRRWSLTERLFLLASVLFTAVLFIVARIAPPNTNDSIGYHMSRVMHWIQNQGLAHYATTIDRQLWMPPWAEMAVMQLYLLKGDDGLSNLVQWFSMVSCLVVVSLIARRLGAGPGGQLFAVLFCATIPMGILQATSTQTDYTTALWLVSLAYYALLAHQRQLSPFEWALVSLTVALGILTKGTYYPFALPFLVWLFVSTLRRVGMKATVGYILLGSLVVGSVNIGVWTRNMITYGFPLGPRESIDVLSNESLTLGILASNLIRNSTLHLGTPYGIINGPARQLVDWFHEVIGQDPNDPRTTLDEYRIKRYLHEDRAGNPFHFLLIPATLLLMIKPNFRSPRLSPQILFALLVLSTFLVFSATYKWQSTGSRLLLPFFVAWAPLAGVAFERRGLMFAKTAAAFVLVAAGVSPLISNPSRSLLPLSSGFADLLSTPRSEVLFANWPEIMPAYLSLTGDIREMGCQDVGIKFNPTDAEYPLWYLLVSEHLDPRIEHLDAPYPSGQYQIRDFHPCAIVCTYCENDFQDDLPLVSVYQGTFFLYGSSPSQVDS
jgi:hypothetical protein